ncbi:MAG: tetratricopeptide repeat protein, partial [Planctomycetales bacterium]|nr:tetratricopeptide repeat protein [Planctomycetales bacterium]
RFWQVIVPGVVVTLMFVASAIGCWRRSPFGFLGMSFFIVLAPTSSFMPIADLAFEHRMYVPLASVVVLVVAVLYGLSLRAIEDESARRLALRTAVTLATLCLIITTVNRNRDYAEHIPLWAKSVELSPWNYRALFTYGQVLGRDGQSEAQIEQLEKSLKIIERGKTHTGLGIAHARLGDTVKAIEHYEAAIRTDPSYVLGYINYGNLRAREGDFPAAVDLYRRALKAQPNHGQAAFRLGMALYQNHQSAEAVELMGKAISIRPELRGADLWRSWILASTADDSLRDSRAALQIAERLRQSGKVVTPRLWDAIAAAQADQGKFDEAISAAEKGLEMAERADDLELINGLRSRLALYRRGQPYRETEPISVIKRQDEDSLD